MGANFSVACHRCKEKAFCLRSFYETGETLTKFFHRHLECGKINPKNLEIVWDWLEEPEWTEEDNDYKDVTDEVCERMKEIESKFKIKG